MTSRVAGEWADDRRSGQGHYFYANGDEYIGEWQNHLRNGQGRYMYASSGLQYEGQWRDGKRTGEGEISRIGGLSVFSIYNRGGSRILFWEGHWQGIWGTEVPQRVPRAAPR